MKLAFCYRENAFRNDICYMISLGLAIPDFEYLRTKTSATTGTSSAAISSSRP